MNLSEKKQSMAQDSEILDLELLIRKSPRSVRAWWTALPDDYQAKDPREQPHRIVTLEKMPNGARLRTYWRTPDGSMFDMEEIMTLRADGSWVFEIPNHPRGFHILDEFRTESVADGSKLHIRSTLTPRDPSAKSQLGTQKERMTQGWRIAAEICERDAT